MPVSKQNPSVYAGSINRYRPGTYLFPFRHRGIDYLLPFATLDAALDWAAGHRIKGSGGEVNKRRGKAAARTAAGG